MENIKNLAQMKKQIKPCVFCGNKKAIPCQSPKAMCEIFVYCKKCFACGPIKYGYQEAIQAWNNRNVLV